MSAAIQHALHTMRSRRRATALIMLLVVAGALLGARAALPAAVVLSPPTQDDPRDTPGSPIDLRHVSFGQKDTLFQLSLVTDGDLKPGELTPTGPNRVCVTMLAAKAAGLVCVVKAGVHPALVYVSLGANGVAGLPVPIDALVGQPDDNTIVATFPPSAIKWPAGPFTWTAQSQWTADPACPASAPCVDSVPDTGAAAFAARSAVLVEPRCFGAASRDPEHPCDNPDLRTSVIPTPADAVITPNAYCAPLPKAGEAHPCQFGLPPAPGRPTVVLAGDSHAAHWRGAVEVAAQAKGWHAISLTRSGCPLTAHPTNGTPARNLACRRWYSAVRTWLVQHPSVHTLITSSHTLDDTPERRADYAATWKALPPSITRVALIRDTPGIQAPQAACINHAIALKTTTLICAQSRAGSLKPDPNAAAARGSGQSRVHVIDLTRFFCGTDLCLATVGGVLIRKDGEHMTEQFATTLGPYLLRALNQIHAG